MRIKLLRRLLQLGSPLRKPSQIVTSASATGAGYCCDLRHSSLAACISVHHVRVSTAAARVESNSQPLFAKQEIRAELRVCTLHQAIMNKG